MAFGPLDKDEMLSKYWTLADLTKTSTGLDNMPPEAEYKNLKWLARTLDDLYDQIGPFNILSAFRTHAVQEALADAGEPASTSRKSFHEAGMAVDIYPTTMSLEEYFGKIAASDEWKTKLGEIIIKPPQKTIHLSLATPAYQGVFKALNSAGVYASLTADQVADYARPYLEYIVQTAEDIGTTITENKNKIMIVGSLAALLLLMMVMSGGKRRVA